MLPVVAPGRELITLGEGWTPLLGDVWDGRAIFWKMDAFMPTGSYKDRGVSVMVNWLAGLDVEVVVDDSSGNAGASLACYAARAGMEAWIYVPESAPMPKRAQVAIYGADLIEVPGPRQNAAKLAKAVTQHNRDTAYASHAWHPAFLLGQMTCAWEIWEQWDAVSRTGSSHPRGMAERCWKRGAVFQHLQLAGMVDRLPHLAAVQAEPYTPFVEAFENRWDRVKPQIVEEPIAADGIAISHPVRDATLLSALYRSQGTVCVVNHGQIMQAQERLARRGIFVEPTSATVAAALEQLQSLIAPGETVVGILTGHGLKNPPNPD
ncbi:MAG: pyridoxal-phosphate dependent enzyme [Caldilineaceae bacterium]